ncbi:MAG: hypothetical protein HQK96_06870 [Nitrospirae bacterium]|nr:hypothetical protein [Nitrospirota bacterium]
MITHKRSITVLILIVSVFLLIEACSAEEKKTAIEERSAALYGITSTLSRTPGTFAFFSEQNLKKEALIKRTLSGYQLIEEKILDPSTGKTTNMISTANFISAPYIEFRKINPTKYRIRVHRAKNSFPIIFSESFSDGWRAEIVPFKRNLQSCALDNLLNYKILEGNDEDQATADHLRSFVDKGLVTYIGDGIPKKREHYRYLSNGRKELTHVEQYTIDFISKDIHGTIQNDNLPIGMFYETWLSGKFDLIQDNNRGSVEDASYNMENWKPNFGLNSKSVELPDLYHWQANGFANSWWVDLGLVRKLHQATIKEEGFYKQNEDGSIDFEIVVEFWPQRLFYIGVFISIVTLVVCIIYLLYNWRKEQLCKKLAAQHGFVAEDSNQ